MILIQVTDMLVPSFCLCYRNLSYVSHLSISVSTGAVDDAKKAQQLNPSLALAFMRTGYVCSLALAHDS